MSLLNVTPLFHIDALAIAMILLVFFIACCVGKFAYQYLQGDSQFRLFFIQFILLASLIIIMVCADNLFLFFGTWCLSNALLVRLMIHKKNWLAAKASGALAAKNYALGALCLAGAFVIFYLIAGETSLQRILHQPFESKAMLLGLVLLIIAAMTQSSIWPFHRWLISSLNSPTPVSAMMHAGLINGGGFLLIRFAPLYFAHDYLLTTLFILGIISALLGTFWKLIQTDVKRMLACSTMSQMGFMLAQCGLGLFASAAAHLMLHGMFKACLFLQSGSAAQEKHFKTQYPPKLWTLVCALAGGVVGSFVFSWITGYSWFAGDTTLVLMWVVLLTGSQLLLPLLQINTLKRLGLALIAAILFGLIYGVSVHLFSRSLASMSLVHPQPLNGFYILGIIALTLPWLGRLFIYYPQKSAHWQKKMLRAYVLALNAGQPNDNTITADRNTTLSLRASCK